MLRGIQCLNTRFKLACTTICLCNIACAILDHLHGASFVPVVVEETGESVRYPFYFLGCVAAVYCVQLFNAAVVAAVVSTVVHDFVLFV